jgi:alpha-tubulin suppressor-like RCC1 family protein
MASPSLAADLQDLPLEVLTHVCRHFGLRDLVRVSQTCKRFRHGGLASVELPTESPVVTVLREHAFSRPELVPSTRPIGCSQSWVAYLARCARQRRCREAPPIAAGYHESLLANPCGRLLTCGKGLGVGHGVLNTVYSDAKPVAAVAGVVVLCVAAGNGHSLALSRDGRVYSWGDNWAGQLGLGETQDRLSPVLVEGLEGVCCVSAASWHSLAMTHSGAVFSWGGAFAPGVEYQNRPTIVDGFGEGVCVRRVCAGERVAFAIGEDGELFSWGCGEWHLGHGDTQDQPSPKRVEALRVDRVSNVSFGRSHVLALAEDGLVYAWGKNESNFVMGNPDVERELLPKPVEALRGVRVSSIAAAWYRSYAVADTGEVWAWGAGAAPPLGHGMQGPCHKPNLIASFRGVKVDAVAAGHNHTLALADDGSVYAWGDAQAARTGALGLGSEVSDAGKPVRKPRRVPALRVASGL